LPDPSRS